VDGPGLALGTTGITPIEMASAYATIANGGVYNEPIAFTVVLDKDMKVVLDAKKIQKSYRVFEESSAFMLIDMLKDVVKTGTGTNAQIDGLTVAGKTGTNNDYTSVYFAGFTGYYTGSLWIGHDLYAEKLATGSTGGNSAAPLWQSFMKKIHEGLSDKPILDVSPADIGVTKVTLCAVSGKLATEACMHDSYNPPITDWCAVDKIPTEECDMHFLADGCTSSYQIAGPYCPSSLRYSKCLLLVNPDSVFAKLRDYENAIANGELDGDQYSGYTPVYRKIFPNAVLTNLSGKEYLAYCLREGKVCQIHGHSSSQPSDLQTLISKANNLISEVTKYLESVQTLPATDRANLESLIASLKAAVAVQNSTNIRTAHNQLKTSYEYLSSLYPLPVSTVTPEPSEAPVNTTTPDITPEVTTAPTTNP
ncbi:MAG: hypothetical protein IKX58_03075, partial [Clostridia bacterium]|nr:hypothetical protein [Clostridia bacterium]